MPKENGSVERFSDLILALNGGLTAEAPWRDFLLLLRGYTNAKHATLILTPRDAIEHGTNISPSVPPTEAREYLERFMAIDPFVGLPEGRVISLYEYIAEEKLRETAYYKQWLEGVDGTHILGVDIRSSGGFEARLRLTRARGADAFTTEERERLEALIPHLRQAIELYQQLETSRSEQAVMTGAVEQFAVGTVILDYNFDVLKVNEIAAAILAERDGISLVGRRLTIGGGERDRAFRAALRSALDDPSAAARTTFLVERPSGNRDLGVAIRPIAIPDFMHTGTVPALALFLSDPRRQHEVSATALRKLFGFTPMEANISASLANGGSVIETARRLGVAENTVRAHLRSVFAKTGATRQSQLVHLIHTSVPELAASL